jgi:hypothetical protein
MDLQSVALALVSIVVATGLVVAFVIAMLPIAERFERRGVSRRAARGAVPQAQHDPEWWPEFERAFAEYADGIERGTT